jgi:hypothetical protein
LVHKAMTVRSPQTVGLGIDTQKRTLDRKPGPAGSYEAGATRLNDCIAWK